MILESQSSLILIIVPTIVFLVDSTVKKSIELFFALSLEQLLISKMFSEKAFSLQSAPLEKRWDSRLVLLIKPLSFPVPVSRKFQFQNLCQIIFRAKKNKNIIVGGKKWVWPLIQKYSKLCLNTMSLEIQSM